MTNNKLTYIASTASKHLHSVSLYEIIGTLFVLLTVMFDTARLENTGLTVPSSPC